MARPSADESITPLWLAHHYPEDYDRCVVVGRRHVCRRCLVLYPIAFLVLAIGLAGVRLPGALEVLLLVVLPLPALAEFVLEHRGRATYEPRRQVLLTIPLGVALGLGFTRYLDDQTDLAFWVVVVAYTVVALVAAFRGRVSPSG